MNIEDRLHALAEVLAYVAGALGLGFGARRFLSKDARDRARDGAEKDYFTTHANEVTLDRDNWRRTAEDGWARLRVKEDEVRERDIMIAIQRLRLETCSSQLKLQRKLIERYPGIGAELDSGTVPFDDKPI